MPLLALEAAFLIFGTISGTKKRDLGMEESKLEKPYKLAILRDRKGDLSKEWYIEFYAFSEAENDLVRKRFKIPLSYVTDESRRKFAARKIKEINNLLREGYFFKAQVVEESNEEELMLLDSLYKVVKNSTAYLRKKSAGTYRSAINKAAEYFTSDVPISQLKKADAYKLRDFFLSKGNNPNTANKTIDHLARLYAKLANRNTLPDNPFRIDSLPETQISASNIAFTDVDRETLEQYLIDHDYELYLFTRYMYFAFIRPRELRQLRIKHIDLVGRAIIVPGEISKNRRTENTAIISPLLAVIKILNYEPEYYIFGASLKPGKGPCSENTPYNRHSKALENTGLNNKGYTLYSWKHTGAVNAYRSGIGLKQLQLLLRHSSIQITDIYLKSLGLRTDPSLESYSW